MAFAFAIPFALAAAAAPPQATPAPALAPADACRSTDSQDITVCAERRQGYRVDPIISDSSRIAEYRSRNATTASPPAQAACAKLPSGCGTGLAGVDLANVAFVVATTALKAVKGQDWTRVLKPGDVDEYQIYLQAKREREEHEAERKAQALAAEARARVDAGSVSAVLVHDHEDQSR